MRASLLTALALTTLPLAAYSADAPPPPVAGSGGLNASSDSYATTQFDDLPEPPADPRDFEGVWLPGAGGGARGGAGARGGGGPPGGAGGPPGGGAPPGASDGGGTLMCAPVQRLNGAGGGMSNLWIVGDKMIAMISEEDMDIRKIYVNAEHPKELTPQPNGHSVGHWEGNTLVVDSVGFSATGGKLSDQHVVERITKTKVGAMWQLKTEATITSNGQTRTTSSAQAWRPDLRVYENVCEEGFERFQIIDGQVRIPVDDPRRKKD